MTYATSNPPKLLVSALGGVGPSLWTYDSTDGTATIDDAGYISNAANLGMKVGDVVIATDTDASPPAVTSHRVVSISAAGAADLSEGVALSGATGD